MTDASILGGAPWRSGDLAWAVPFGGLLLSIALLPIVSPRLWHRRQGVIGVFWVATLLLPAARAHGAEALAVAWHAILVDYLPFVTVLLALYASGGGILIRGGPWGRPWGNTLLLGIGTALAGVMGTTGAAMVFIHPLLRANTHRTHKGHLVLFFIVLVANAGGATTPLGDPPLFIGYLRGVPFGWPAAHLGLPLLFLTAVLLGVFYGLDRWLAAADPPAPPRERFHVRGGMNVALLALTVAVVTAGSAWRDEATVLGVPIAAGRLAGVLILPALALVSAVATPLRVRQENFFSWSPISEVAKLFAAIFILAAPVLNMLAMGDAGPFGPLLRLTRDAGGAPVSAAFFWLGGGLSAVLDNAPTYLVFFEVAGGDAARLTHEAGVLAALSAGSVFFGALTYIGNAPNLMVRAIASRRGVRMPGLFAYSGLAAALLLPVFAAMAAIFFRR